MAFDRAVEHLGALGLADRVLVFDQSSATVELAAAAVGCEPARIVKTLSFLVGDAPVLVLAAGDARVDNRAFKDAFGVKPRMIARDRVEELVGHEIGGVCPFGVPEGVDVHLDRSIQRFDEVFPACGSANSAVRLSPDELAHAAGSQSWVEVTQTAPAG